MKSPKTIRGSALIIVLWMIVILIVVTAALAQSSRLSSRISQSYGSQCKCRWAVRAAIETAINVLAEDDSSYDAFDELWHHNPDVFQDIKLMGATACVKVTDECSKLNVNTADKKQLTHLLKMTDEQADSIIDWRDEDSNVSGGGAEAEYYNSLEYPYPIRNAPFQTVHEVLLVKGMQDDAFYGQDFNLNGQLDANEKEGRDANADKELEKGLAAFLTCYSFCKNVDAQGNERVNVNEATEEQLQQELNLSKSHAKWVKQKANGIKSIGDLISKDSPKGKNKADDDEDSAQPIDLETFKQIADKITVSKEKILPGRVNINTASREVLIALLEGNEQLAEEIIKYRDTLEEPMTSIAGLLDAKGMTVKKFKKIAARITVRSDVFSLYATAVSDSTGLTYTARAVISRDATSCKIIYWYEGIGN